MKKPQFADMGGRGKADVGRRKKVVFPVFADAANPNAQSLNAREIALRLDPGTFRSTLFFLTEPDPRLQGPSHIRLRRIPPRGGSLLMAAELLWGGHDLVFAPVGTRAAELFWRLRSFARHSRVLSTVEAVAAEFGLMETAARERHVTRFKQSDACYALTEKVAETMEQSHGLKLSVIPVGVNLSIFQPAVRTDRLPPWRVLYVGTLQRLKRPHLVVELARRLTDSPVEFHLVGQHLGDLQYYSSLRGGGESPTPKNVFFHGPLRQQQVAVWMAKSDVLVLPSRLEGLPKVTLEAAATGLPSLVFADYGTPSVIDGVTGFQVKDFDTMAERLKLLLEDRSLRLRMGAAAVTHAMKFDWDLVAKQWENAIRKLLTAPS